MTTPTEGKAGVTPCPACKSIPNPETGQCLCRRAPDRWIPNANLSSAAHVPHAESLFDKYLAARLVRARRALTVAKVALLRDPRNRQKLEALHAAEAETERLHAQVLAQTRKAASAVSSAAPSRDNEAPTASPEATPDFRMIQAAKAEAAYQSADAGRISRPDDRLCPKCGERLPGDAAACVCGHPFPSVEDKKLVAEPFLGEEPFLTEEEVAALRGKPLRRAE